MLALQIESTAEWTEQTEPFYSKSSTTQLPLYRSIANFMSRAREGAAAVPAPLQVQSQKDNTFANYASRFGLNRS
jgi:hypothetical protein